MGPPKYHDIFLQEHLKADGNSTIMFPLLKKVTSGTRQDNITLWKRLSQTKDWLWYEYFKVEETTDAEGVGGKIIETAGIWLPSYTIFQKETDFTPFQALNLSFNPKNCCVHLDSMIKLGTEPKSHFFNSTLKSHQKNNLIFDSNNDNIRK